MTFLRGKLSGVKPWVELFVKFMRTGSATVEGVQLRVDGNTSPAFILEGVGGVSVRFPSGCLTAEYGAVKLHLGRVQIMEPQLVEYFTTGAFRMGAVAGFEISLQVSSDPRPALEWHGDHVQISWPRGVARIVKPGFDPEVESVRLYADRAEIVLANYPDGLLEFI